MEKIIIIRNQDLIEKIDLLKKKFNRKTRTKYIETLVNYEFERYVKYGNTFGDILESELIKDNVVIENIKNLKEIKDNL